MIAFFRLLTITCLLFTAYTNSSPGADVDQYGDPLPPGAVARLGTKRFQLSSVIRRIAFLPDGKTLISASESIRVWDAATGQLKREMADAPGWMISLLAISPDGKIMAWGGRRETIHLLEIATGRQLSRLTGHKYYSECIAFSPDGKVLASGGRDDSIRLWDVTTGKQVAEWNNPGWRTSYLAYSADGKTLVSFTPIESGNGPGDLRWWDVETRKLLRKWENVTQPTMLSPDGKIMVTGAKGQHLRLLDAATEKEIRQFALPSREGVIDYEAAQCLAFSRDSKFLAVGDVTDRVHVWALESGKELYCLPPMPDAVTCLTFSPDGKTLAVGAWQRIRLWDATTGKEILAHGGSTTQINHVTFTPDNKAAVTWSGDLLSGQTITFWDPLTGHERNRLPEGRGDLIGFSPAGNLLFGKAGKIVEWPMNVDKALRTLKVIDRAPPDGIVELTAKFSRDGTMIVTGSNDRTIRLWDWKTGDLRWSARRENKGVRFPADIGGHWPLGFTHDGKAVVSMADDAVIRLWDVATGKEVRSFRINAKSARLSPDGKFLLAIGKHIAAPDGHSEESSSAPPRLYDLTTDGEPKPTQFYPKDASPAVFSPDGTLVAMSVGRADVVLVERASGKELRRLKGHKDGVISLAFSPDGRFLISGSFDTTALIWDLR
jgi:WD40 repeat protein